MRQRRWRGDGQHGIASRAMGRIREYVQQTGGEDGTDAQLHFGVHAEVPDRPDGKDQNGQIGDHVDDAHGNEGVKRLDAVPGRKQRVPDTRLGRALEQDGEKGAKIEGEVGPEEDVDRDVHGALLGRDEGALELQKQRGFGKPREDAVDELNGPAELRERVSTRAVFVATLAVVRASGTCATRTASTARTSQTCRPNPETPCAIAMAL